MFRSIIALAATAALSGGAAVAHADTPSTVDASGSTLTFVGGTGAIGHNVNVSYSGCTMVFAPGHTGMSYSSWTMKCGWIYVSDNQPLTTTTPGCQAGGAAGHYYASCPGYFTTVRGTFADNSPGLNYFQPLNARDPYGIPTTTPQMTQLRYVLTGGAGSDWLTGGSLADTLVGNGGRDMLQGLGGDDMLDSHDGILDDAAICGDGTDTLVRDTADTFDTSSCEQITVR